MAQQHQVGRTATTISTEDGETRVTYHSTAVVKFTAKRVTLNSGGWMTATTKTRMNQASRQFGLGYSVFQKMYVWYVRLPDGSGVPFEDGMTFKRPE